MKIVIASDHAGFELKEAIKTFFLSQYEWIDKGTSSSYSVDYPDFAHSLANAIEMGEANMGILLCGSGNGVAMSANKHDGIRAALCWQEEIAHLARLHNDANVLVLPARFISQELAFNIVKVFFNTSFEGGRHEKRVCKINYKDYYGRS